MHLKEQLNDYIVVEFYLELVDCKNKRMGDDIANLILNTLTKNNIPIAVDCRCRGYDNGSNMSGSYKV